MGLLYSQSKWIQAHTHISFVPHTLPPLRKPNHHLIENIFSHRIVLNLRIIMDISMNLVENVSLQYSQELHYDSDSQKQ